MAPTAVAEPAAIVATIRTLIVAVPADVPTTVLADREALHRHLGVTGNPEPRFWARTRMPWEGRLLIDRRSQHRQTYAAGGPIRLLNLAAQRHAVAVGAGIRHHQWTEIVQGTKPATPWSEHLRRHHADPTKHPLDWAKATFAAQPRVQAMAVHNAAFGPQFDIDDLEAFQAGAHAFATYSAMRAVCGDGLLTGGTKMQPDSDSLTDRIAYLGQAHQHLQGLDRGQRILALTV